MDTKRESFITALIVIGLLASLYFAVVGVLSFAAYGDFAALIALVLILLLIVRGIRRSHRH
ncbi:MAG: hypothetical protein ABL953_00290 [Ilumatobacteraceae bacterium]